MINKTLSTLLLLSLLSPLFGAEGDILLFDEFRDPQESSKNWFSFIRRLPAGDQHYLDKSKAVIADGMIQLNNSRLFSTVKNIRNCEVEFEFQMAEDQVEEGKHRGFVGNLSRCFTLNIYASPRQ